jgi:XTP/dITP diphosphohydrolase
MSKRLLLASENRGKLVEIQALLEHLDLELVLPGDLGLHLDVVEDGITYAQNAARKAAAFAKAGGLTALGDDSGLEVDALGGQPGLYSARFNPKPGATDADRRAYLLERLRGKTRPWTAHFHCTVAIATPGGEVLYAEGDCPGEIIPEERGSNGFGYDAIFRVEDLDLTMAELDMGVKNRLSHRARAVRAAVPLLERLFGMG